jgi:hypothetical protein
VLLELRLSSFTKANTYYSGGNFMGTSRFSMKKALSFTQFAALSLVIGGSALAATGAISLSDVNQKVATLVAPFNDQKTAMDFSFTRLAVDEVRATEFGFKGYFVKTGTNNEVTLDIPTAEYSFGDGTNPTAKLSLSLKFDVVKALGQKLINEFSEGLEDLVVDSAKGYTEEYGTAATIDAKVSEKKVDANGDVEAVKMSLSAKVDLAQLPAEKPVAETEFKSLDLEISGSRDGFEISATVVLNPEYKRFLVGDDGLKEYVEKLLADDQEAYAELSQFLAILNSVAAWIAEMDANKSPFAF